MLSTRLGLAVRILLLGLALSLATTSRTGAATPPLEDGHSLARAVFEVLDARLALMPDVAAAKWIAGQPVGDPAREDVVVHAAGADAAALGLDPAPVEALFRQQIALARAVQERAFARWRTGEQAPSSAPSLRDDLRPRIDRLTRSLLRALYLAAPTVSGADWAQLALGLPDGRWSPAERDSVRRTLASIHVTAPRSPERMRQSGVLRIGLPGDYAPFARAAEGGVVGADVTLTDQLANRLGVTAVYVRSRWDTLLEDLAEDRFDLAAGGISITPARQAVAGFSAPLIRGGKTAVGRCADRDRYASAEAIDSPGVRVIENPGGTNESYARRHVTHATLIVHTDNLSVFAEISAGRADVMYTDDIEIAGLTRRDPSLCRLLATVDEPTDKALLLPPDPAWKRLVDTALASLLEDEPYAQRLQPDPNP